MHLESLLPASPSSSPPHAQNHSSSVPTLSTLTPPLPPTPSQVPSPLSQMPSSPQSPPPPPPLPTPQVYELTPPPPSSIAAALPKPSEATEAKPNNHAQQEESRSTSQGDASLTTKPEQAQVLSDHDNPSDDIKGKTIHNSSDHSSDCNRNFGTGDDPKIVYDPGGYTLNPKDDSMRDDGTDTTISSDNASCLADNHNNINRSDNAFPFPNTDVTSITDHGCSDCDHPHNPHCKVESY